MKQNADFQEGISQAQNTSTSLPTQKILTTYKSFQMRYYIGIWPKDKVLVFWLYLIKCEFFGAFSIYPWQFSCPLRKILTWYLIWKLS